MVFFFFLLFISSVESHQQGRILFLIAISLGFCNFIGQPDTFLLNVLLEKCTFQYELNYDLSIIPDPCSKKKTFGKPDKTLQSAVCFHDMCCKISP